MATNKKCWFAKTGTRIYKPLKKKKTKVLSSTERAKKLSEWRKSIW